MIYIWNRVEGLTEKFHDSGGLLVSAPTLDIAREIVRGYREEWRRANDGYGYGVDREFEESLNCPPDHEWESAAPSGTVLVFPDAGCC